MLTDAISVTELRRSMTRVSRLLTGSMPKGGLSPMKLAALAILHRDGPHSASALASRLRILPQSLTRILSDLENEGLMTRSHDARDGREHILQPTPKAVALLQVEGERRDATLRAAMERALTPIETQMLFVAAKAINKIADAWGVPDQAKEVEQTFE